MRKIDKLMISLLVLLGISNLFMRKLQAQEKADIRVAQLFNQESHKFVQVQSLKEVLTEIEDHYQVFFNYNLKLVEGKTTRFSRNQLKNKSFEVALSSLLTPFDLEFKKIESNYYIIFGKKRPTPTKKTREKSSKISLESVKVNTNQIPSFEKEIRIPKEEAIKSVSGQVSDKSGEALPGVNIIVKGTTIGTISDKEGKYLLSVPTGRNTLIFSFVGYLPQEIEINGQTTINVTLEENLEELEEVVVVGYGTVKKSDLTGSVASVKSDEIAAYPALSTVQALQGRASGVQITANNGEPGSSFKVRIRGGTSINASSDPLYVVDGFIGGVLPPPEDIESIEVLKDASATAIYGSRGANGVIMVTTKRGKSGKPQINLNASYSFQNEINRLDLLGADDFVTYIQEVNPNYVGGTADTDWQDVVLRNGAIQNYQLSIAGGTDNVKYYVSGTYFNQEGILINSHYDRFSMSTNLDIKATEKLKLGINLFGRRTSRDGVRTQESSGGPNNTGVIAAAFKMEPDKGIFNEDGTFARASINDPHDNPFAVATEQANEQIQDRVQANLFADYEIINGLKFRTSFGIKLDNDRVGNYTPVTLNQGAGVGGLGDIDTDKRILLLNESYLTFNKRFNEQHDFTVMAGYSYQKSRSEGWRARAQSFTTDAGIFWGLGNSSVWLAPEASLTEWELSSWFGRLNYSFNDRYLITLNGRYDGSSRLAEGNKWAFFPSGAIAWNIGNESFMDGIPWLSQAKIRTSYGVTGNQSVNPYGTLAGFGSVFYAVNGDPVNAVRPTVVANEDLSWEQVLQFDIGTDISLLQDRIYFTFDYYHRKTIDLLFSFPLPEYSGYSSVVRNVGELENKGFELSLTSQNLVGDFKWSTTLNLSRNRSKVLKLPENSLEGNPIFYEAAPGHMVGFNNNQVLQEELPVGSFFGFVYDGVYQEGDDFLDGGEQEAGGEKYRDLNGDGVLNNDDRQVIGDPNPDFIWGLSNDFSWKNFDLNVFFQGSQGNDLYSFTLMELDLMAGQNNASTAALNRWTPDNTNTNIPKAAPRSRRSSTRWVYDASYIRLKNISLGYNLPGSILEKIKIRKLRVYFSAQNIWTITDYPGYDPEVNYSSGGSGTDSNRNIGLDYGSYPNAKSYTLGLNLGF